MDLCIKDLAEIIGGRLQLGSMPPLCGDLEQVGKIVVDCRRLQQGNVLWALPEELASNRSAIQQAFSQGAAGIITSGRQTEPWPGKFIISVEDTRWALWQLARHLRQQFAGKVIAVAAGQSQTAIQTMLHHVLRQRLEGSGGRDSACPAAVPLSLCDIRSHHEYAIVPLGEREERNAQQYNRLCQADVTICEQSEGFLSLHFGDEVFTVGRSPACDLTAENIRCRQGQLEFTLENQPMQIAWPGRHHLETALASHAVARRFGIPATAIAQGLRTLPNLPGHCEVSRLGNITLIDNSGGPDGLFNGMQLLCDLGVQRRIVVCTAGGMLSPAAEIANSLVHRFGAELLVACGETAEELAAAAIARGMPARHVFLAAGSHEAYQLLAEQTTAGDGILVNGSELEGLVNLLQGKQQTSEKIAA